MLDLKIVSENSKNLFLEWSENSKANKYVIEGVTDIFNSIRIEETNENNIIIEKKDNCCGYKVVAMFNNMIIESSDVINIKNDLDNIEIFYLPAPKNKISFSFRSTVQYDKYIVYDSYNNIITETEDPIFIYENMNVSYVEGFIKNGDKFELKGISKNEKQEIIIDNSRKKKISIIIPVYNSNEFIIRLVQSILSSTYTRLEILLIDDNSEEYTRSICDEYAQMYPKHIRVFHNKKNKCICGSRNVGLKNVRCEWTAFMDHDDMVHPYMYEKLLKAAEETGSDCAIAQCVMRKGYYDYELVLAGDGKEDNVVMSFEQMIKEKYQGERNIYFVAIWNKIVKTEIATKVEFIEDKPYYEDQAYTDSVYSFVNKFVLVKGAYHIWDKRKQKTVGTASHHVYKNVSGEKLWGYYVESYMHVLEAGNQDQDIANVYKYDLIKLLLDNFTKKLIRTNCPAEKVFMASFKYYANRYELPFNKLLDDRNNRKLYDAWLQINNSNIPEWNVKNEPPQECYK